MKKLMMSLALSVVLVLLLGIPVKAVPPGYEEWQLYRDGFGNSAYYLINTTNLQVESFTVISVARSGIGLKIIQRDELIFWIKADIGQTVTQGISGFKFQRLPANDPDDPSSIRYPPNTSIFVGMGTYEELPP